MKVKAFTDKEYAMSLYERCIGLAIKLSEKDISYANNLNWNGNNIPSISPKYNSDEVFKLSDKLYAKIKGAK